MLIEGGNGPMKIQAKYVVCLSVHIFVQISTLMLGMHCYVEILSWEKTKQRMEKEVFIFEKQKSTVPYYYFAKFCNKVQYPIITLQNFAKYSTHSGFRGCLSVCVSVLLCVTTSLFTA